MTMGIRNCTMLLALSCMFCGAAFGASAVSSASELWQISAGMGYTHYNDASSNDGNTVFGRLALDMTPWHRDRLTTGLELGVQSGNQMKLGVPCEVLFPMGGVAINSTIKPMVDLLARFQLALNEPQTRFLIVKAGGAYRQWEFDRETVSNLSQISPELQAGFGVRITPRTKLVAYYQGIYSGKMGFKTHIIDQFHACGSVDHIPTQNGGFLSIETEL